MAKTRQSAQEAVPVRRRWLRPLLIAAVVAVVLVSLRALVPSAAAGLRQVRSLPAPSWPWIIVAVVAVALGFVCSAIVVRAAAGRPVPLGRMVLVELAATVANRATPAGIGGAAVIIRFLSRKGMKPLDAAAAVGLGAAAHGVIMTIGVLAALPAVLSFPGIDVDLGGVAGQLMVVGGAVLVAGLMAVALRLVVVRTGRGARLLSQAIAAGASALRALRHDPRRVGVMLLAAAGLRATNCVALIAIVSAFGGHVTAWYVAAVYLAGSAIAAAVPTPSGIGGVELALVTGLVAAGAGTAGVAVAAVATYRLLSFWAPIVPGTLASAFLRRRLAI